MSYCEPNPPADSFPGIVGILKIKLEDVKKIQESVIVIV